MWSTSGCLRGCLCVGDLLRISSGSVGEDYGGEEARPKVAERALKVALWIGWTFGGFRDGK
ncbi:hypothetical protein MesoLjLa_56870 [Mesorhizobium sp. L-2-11]|nr:hypothetical protein MesoLjLa_56870 [Mesorhizobium sp. L-2-11]